MYCSSLWLDPGALGSAGARGVVSRRLGVLVLASSLGVLVSSHRHRRGVLGPFLIVVGPWCLFESSVPAVIHLQFPACKQGLAVVGQRCRGILLGG